MYELSKSSPSEERHITSQFCFVQPVHSRLMMNVENPVYEYFNAKYLSYYPSDLISRTNCTNSKFIKTCNSCINPIFQTNQGFEICPCGGNIEDKLYPLKEIQELPAIQEKSTEDIKINKNELHVTRSASCDGDYGESFKRDRRVSILVDELLLKIYGGRDRKFSSGGTDIRENVDYSTDSSNSITLSNTVLKKKRSFSGISEDKCQKWYALVRARLMTKSLKELKTLKETLEYNISHTGSQLIRQLKRRDLLFSRRDAQYDVITAFLQAKSAKRSEDTRMQFSMKPSAGESGFQQWHSAMKMVARLPGGIPHEFRKTLWLTLAERHISSRKINWHQVERTCFNDSTNPDDEELGVQIVKDLHRTGCSLFCGTSGEQNQAVLKRVLLAYARWNKFVGYCQGFNMLAALILEVMDRCEYDSLKVMIYLIEGVLPESYFANSLRGLSIDMAVFRDLLRLKLPELSKHLEKLQTGSNDAGNTYEPPLTNVFTMQWFLTLFCNCLPHSTVLRVWDLVFLEGNQVLLKTALAIWDTLSDRIMPVKSADEFYSIMGVLTREMLEFGLMDANCLIKTISNIELFELTELRERYIYNITPWTQVARKGLRLFYSDEETDGSDEEQNDDKISEGAYGFLKAATKHGSQSIRSISPSSILSPFANEKEKIALDISALKKQYSKIKERQRQAQIIFTAACNTHGFMGSMVSTPTPPMNHLLLNKTPTVSKPQKFQKPPTIPISRAVQRLKESSSSIADESSKDRGETVYWDKRVKKKKRKRRIDSSQKSLDLKEHLDNHVDSDSSSSSTSSASFKSSSSTELCDDFGEFDSDNTSLSECCSSPLYRIQSSNVLFVDEDKANVKEEEEIQEDEECSQVKYEEREHILNVLLTTSIMVNEQLNQPKTSDKLDEPISDENFSRQLTYDNIMNTCINNECEIKIDDPVCDIHAENYFQSDTVCDVAINSDISQDMKVNEEISGDVDRQHVSESNVSSDEIDTALEHMKIDALEILFSSSTLESIKNESPTENFTSFDLPVIVTEDETSFHEDVYRFKNITTSPIEESNKSGVSQLEFTSLYDYGHQIAQNESTLDESVQRNEDIKHVDQVAEDYINFTPENKSIIYDKETSSYPGKELIYENTVLENQFDFNDYGPPLNSNVFTNENNASHDLLSFENPPSTEKTATSEFLGSIEESWWESSKNNAEVMKTKTNNVNECSQLDIFSNECNLSLQNSDQATLSFNKSIDSNPEINQYQSMDRYDDQFNNTETALENILRENTEVLKKVYHKYSSSMSCDFDSISSNYRDSISSDGESGSLNLPKSRLKTKDIKFHSLDYPIHFDECKKRPRRKHKSLDSLNTKKSKLKIGLLSKNCKWISISIDNSDLAMLNVPTKMSSEICQSEYSDKSCILAKSPRIHSSVSEKACKNDFNSPQYLHLNFDIIGTGRKKKDPIQEYVHKKNVLSQSFKSSSDLAPLNFNPFPSRSNIRPPKELGIKLGLYSSNKTK